MLEHQDFLSDGTARLLDMQFRLLREDMLNLIRLGISYFLKDLDKNKSQIKKKLCEESGRFQYDKDNATLDLFLLTYINTVDLFLE